MKIGDIVKFKRSTGAAITGMIINITPKTVVLKVDGCRWHVPVEEVYLYEDI
jgi:Holliday junction resolvasome RuvABC DNA-binding subunit